MLATDWKGVSESVFSSETSFAGRILVFSGAIFTSFDSYDKIVRESVHKKRKRHAWMALTGFAGSLLAGMIFATGFAIFLVPVSLVMVGRRSRRSPGQKVASAPARDDQAPPALCWPTPGARALRL